MLHSDFIEIDGLTYHIQQDIISPNRPTILFLHDSLGSVKLWRDFPLQVSKSTNCNILVYDREGHGESSPFQMPARPTNYLEIEADTLHKIITHLNLKNVILFGHSDGATISLLYAAKYAEYVLGTIVEGVHVFVENVTLNGIKNAQYQLETTNLKERVAKYHGDKTAELFKMWIETWLNPTYKDWNIEKEIKSIQAPVLIFQGENDEFGTMEQVEKIKKNVTSKVIDFLVPECGHNPHKEKPEFIIKQVTQFISQEINYNETL